MNQTESIFTEQGGVFCTPVGEFLQKLSNVKAYIFDWDGVFNDGMKNEHGSSAFSEIDAMGTNLLRFSHYLHKKQMPCVAVMSGEKNVLSFQYGMREHVHSIYYRVKNKGLAFTHFIQEQQLSPDEVAFVFDDVLDLSLAEVCGIRILVNRTANPLFKNYVIKNQLTDYVTGQTSGNFALREACELFMGLHGNFEMTIQHRAKFSTSYENYLSERQRIITHFYTWQNNVIEQVIEP